MNPEDTALFRFLLFGSIAMIVFPGYLLAPFKVVLFDKDPAKPRENVVRYIGVAAFTILVVLYAFGYWKIG